MIHDIKAKAKRLAVGLALSAGLLGVATVEAAAAYPERQVTIIVPSAPGAGNDVVARLFAAYAEKRFGKTFVVENKAGAQTALGAKFVASAKPDGYTVLLIPSSPTAYKALYKQPPVSLGEFEFVSLIMRAPQIVAANSKYKTVADLVAASKANPNGVVVASYGGSIHLLTAIFNKAAGIKTRSVQFSSSQEAAKSVAAGDADFFLASQSALNAWEGKINRLAVTTQDRSKDIPSLPSTKEVGLDVADLTVWIGVMLPRGTPAEIVNTLNQAVRDFAADPENAKRLREIGFEPYTNSPAEFRAFAEKEEALLAEAAETSGVEKQ